MYRSRIPVLALAGALLVGSPAHAQYGVSTVEGVKVASLAHAELTAQLEELGNRQQSMRNFISQVRSLVSMPDAKREGALRGAVQSLAHAERQLKMEQLVLETWESFQPIISLSSPAEFVPAASAWVDEQQARVDQLAERVKQLNQDAYAARSEGAEGMERLQELKIEASSAEQERRSLDGIIRVVRGYLNSVDDDRLPGYRWGVENSVLRAREQVQRNTPARIEQARAVVAAYDLAPDELSSKLQVLQEELQSLDAERQSLASQASLAQRDAQGFIANGDAGRSPLVTAAIDERVLNRAGGVLPSGMHVAMSGLSNGGLRMVHNGSLYNVTIRITDPARPAPFFAVDMDGSSAKVAPGQNAYNAAVIYVGRFTLNIDLAAKGSPEPADFAEVGRAVAICLDLDALAEF